MGLGCEYTVWNSKAHRLMRCGEEGATCAVPSGMGIKIVDPNYSNLGWDIGSYLKSPREVCLCADHAECLDEILKGVIDTDGNITHQPEFTYRLPNMTPRVRNVGKSSVKEIVEPPDPEWMAIKAKMEALIRTSRHEKYRKELQAELDSIRKARGVAYATKKREAIEHWSHVDPVWAAGQQAERPAALAIATPTVKEIVKDRSSFVASHVYISTVPDALASVKVSVPDAAPVVVAGIPFEYRDEGGSGYYFHGRRVAVTREGLEKMASVLARMCK